MLNVLYVDDDPGLLEIGRIFLEATAEFSVDTLTSAADAISRIAEKPFDAIISDYQMPDLNGIAFLKTVRASGNTIPFILFTGRGREEIVIEALNEGADFYIQKGGETQAQFVELAHKIKKAVETRRFEAALRASEIWFRSIIQHASEYILVVNHSGEVTYTSPSYYQRGGYPENSLIGKNPLILVHPDDLERVSREFADSFDPAHIPVPTVYRARKADGTYLWVESLASNLFGIPEIGGIVITSRDITKRKEAEDELYASNQQLIASEEELRRQFDTLSRSEILIRESESRLRFMLGFYDLARKPDKEILTYAVEGAGVITGSPLGYLAFLNDDETELRMYAWSKTAMRECSMREKPLIYPVEKTGLWGEAVRQRRAVITNDYAAPNPKKKGCPPGHPQIVRHMNVPIFDGNHIVMIAGVANRPSDYTENEARHLTLLMQELWQILKRRRVEKALTKNEIRFRSIIQHSDDIILAINREGVITYASPASKTVLGYGEEDLLGKNPLDFVHPDDRDRIAGTLNGLFTTDREARLHEFRTKKADGSWTYLEAIGSNLMNIPGIEGFMITLRDITKRRMTEVALRESEEKFRGIFNNINDAVHIHEIDKNGQPGRFLDVNDVACRMLQYSREELLAAGPLDFADSWHSRPLGEITDDLRDKGHAFFETFHIRKDGTKVPVEINAIVTRILGAKVVVSVIRDITDRKRSENELVKKNEVLQESEGRFRNLLSHSLDAILIHQDGRIILANETAAELLGAATPEDLKGKPLLDVIHPDYREIVTARVNNITNYPDKTLPPIEERFLRLDGTAFDIEGLATATIHEGKPAVFVVFRDISERKRAEEAIRESEEINRKVIATVPDIVIRTDLNGTVRYANEKVLGLGGYDADKEIIGTPIFQYIAPEDLPRALENVRLMAERQLGPVEYTLIAKDGARHAVEINGDMLRNPDGSPYGMVFVGRDVTQRKKTEEAIRNAHRQLTLLSSITRHDIRNKVTIQLGLLALAERKARDNPDLEALLGKLESATRAIRDQIEFTRIYQDLGCHDPRWQDLHQVLAKTTVPPSLSVADTCAGTEVFADIMLEKVFGNLIDNAVRHGGNVTQISLSAKEVQGTLVIRFEDNGTGIPEHEKKKIFERGYGKNTGLGLFLAREVLALTGITIAETGTPGKGAQFEMVVPAGAWRYGNRPGPG